MNFDKSMRNMSKNVALLSTAEDRDEMIREWNEQRQQIYLQSRRMVESGEFVGIKTTDQTKTSLNKKHKKNRNKNKKEMQLSPLFINELRKCDIYSGKQLIGRTVVMPMTMNAIHTIIEDDFGSVVRVSIYGDSNENKYRKGVKICIQEPYYKVSQDGTYRIRMDDPSKVIIISNKIPIGVKEKSANNWKDLANKCFMDKNYKYANQCYSEGINYYDDINNDDVITALLNNRSLCYIKQNKYKLAFINIIASKYINSNVCKTWQREILCLDQLKHHKQAFSVWQEAMKLFPNYQQQFKQFEKKLKLKIKSKSGEEEKINTQFNAGLDDEWDVLGVIIDDIENIHNKGSRIKVVIDDQTNKSGKVLAKQLKEIGNKHFKDGKYEEAIQCYTDCLVKHYNILSILLSNRSASYIQLKKHKKAFQDATISVIINSNNIKGWFRRSIMSFELNLNDIGKAICKQYDNEQNEIFTKLMKSFSDKPLYTLDTFNTDIVYQNVPKENIMNLKSGPRIRHILRLYDNWINVKKNQCEFSFGTFLANHLNYRHYNILNDFHQTLQNDNNDDIDAKNDNYLCKSSNCHYMVRNNRDRAMIRKSCSNHDAMRRKMYFGYDDSPNCSLFQTLDTIHCAIYHKNTNRDKLNDKFVMNVKVKCKNENDIDQKTENDDNKDNTIYNNFGFGEPFVYYDELRASGIHVTPFYNTLEDELLHNPYYRFTKQEYNDIYIKASNLLQTYLFTKQIGAKFCGDGERIGIKKGDHLTINHIISLLIYCNETDAQKIFKEQCRKTNANETIQDIMKKHSYIANWMMFLWETTRIYGTLLGPNNVVYTGMNCKLLFSSFSEFYYAPLSTSSSNIVARDFATSDGIVVKLKSCNGDARYFDMMPISDFVQEKEKFFLSAKLNIIDIIIDRSYFVEVCALRLFERIISGVLFYNDCNLELITDDVQIKLTHFIDNYLEKKNYEQGSNLNYMQTMFNNMICNFLNPQNYDTQKLQRLDNDTFLIFIDKEEINKLNPKLSEYFYTKNNNKKQQKTYNYGLLLNSLNQKNQSIINFCCKRIVLRFNKKQLQKLKTETKILRMRYCYTTDPFTISYTSPDGINKSFTFHLRICKASGENGDVYEFFFNDLTKQDHNIRVSYDFFCTEIKYQQLGRTTFFSYGTDMGFVGFSCSRLNNILSELHIILNFRILEMT